MQNLESKKEKNYMCKLAKKMKHKNQDVLVKVIN